MIFLRSFLKGHFVVRPVVASPKCQVPVKYWPNVSGLLINMSTDSRLSVGRHVDRVHPPIVSTNTWPSGAQISQDLIQNYHPKACHLGNLVVLDQINGANL